MTAEENQKILFEITKDLIAEKKDDLKLKHAIEELKRLVERVSGLKKDALSNSENIALPNGQAIGPKWAGMCLEDLMRTYAFINGIHKAIKKVKGKNSKKPVTVIYAGTGPYATLILPLLSHYKPSELQLVLIEVNPISIESLKQVFKGLGANGYIKAMYQCDASNFCIPSEINADILIIECMQHALIKEPQVAITYNLLSQMKKETILIPENISLHLSLIDYKKKIEYQKTIESPQPQPIVFYENTEAVFMLNKAEVCKNSSDFKKEGFQFPEKEIHFSEEQLSNYDQITVATEITIFQDISLKMDESGLTAPFILADLNQDQKIIGVKTRYILGANPGLAIQLVRS